MKILLTTCGGVVRGIKGWTEYAMAKKLVERGHDVTVLTSSSVMKLHAAKKTETIDGIYVKRFNPYLPTSLCYMLRGDWDVVNAHFMGFMASISSYAILRKKIKNIPVVHNVMGLYHDPYIVESVDDPLKYKIKYENMQRSFPTNPLRIKNWFSHLPIYNSEIVGGLTRWEMNEIRKFGIPNERIRHMPICVDLGLFRGKRKNFKEKHDIDGKMILFVGQPIPRKGPEYLIKAMANVIRKYPDAKCVFVGYKSSPEIEKMCKSLNIEKNVIFIGFLNEEEKIDAYRSADVFVLPTLYEGFGIVFIEAMASGCPIVTTNVAGVPEIVENIKNGILTRPRNSDDIATGIIKILDSKALARKISKNNTKKAKLYDWNKLVKLYESCFEDAARARI